jgi:hypothetical protein
MRFKRRRGKKLSSHDSHNHFDEFEIAGNNRDMVLGAYSVHDFKTNSIILNRFKQGLSSHAEELKLISTPRHWIKFVVDHYGAQSMFRYDFDEDSGFVYTEDRLNYISYSISGDTLRVNINGSKDFTESNKVLIEKNFQSVQSFIRWVHNSNGSEVTLALDDSMLPVAEMYPWLNGETLEDYYDRFLNSSASILLLYGDPGVGKTSLIRGLLNYAKTSALVTYDPMILQKDSFFAEFLEDNSVSIVVLEDSDAFLSARSDGNTMMHRFLNVSNGLITVKGKKMIFSTNLPSIRDIDPALTRAGRCFDIVKFEKLNYEQASKLANIMGIRVPNDKEQSYTIAELFHESNTNPSPRFGFNQ